MSDDKTQILIRALEASGSSREADLARAILGEPAQAPAAPATETPGQAYVREQQAQAATLPEGIMSEAELAEWERQPAPRSGAEQQQRIAETDRVWESYRYHEGQR